MKSLFLHWLIILFAIFPLCSNAQDIYIVDSSSEENPLIVPIIAMTPVSVEPDCHTYTGCGVILVKKYTYQKPKVYKHKVKRVHKSSCCYSGCDVRVVTRTCY